MVFKGPHRSNIYRVNVAQEETCTSSNANFREAVALWVISTDSSGIC